MKPLPQPSMVTAALFALASLTLARAVDDSALDPAAAQLFGPENTEELLAERDDLQQQLVLKNNEFLAQHRRADVLELKVHKLESQLSALREKIGKVQSVFEATLGSSILGPAPAAKPAHPSKTAAKHQPRKPHAEQKTVHAHVQRHTKPAPAKKVEEAPAAAPVPAQTPAPVVAAAAPPPAATPAPKAAAKPTAAPTKVAAPIVHTTAAPAAPATTAAPAAPIAAAKVDKANALDDDVAELSADAPVAPPPPDVAPEQPKAAPTKAPAAAATEDVEPATPAAPAAPAAPIAAASTAEKSTVKSNDTSAVSGEEAKTFEEIEAQLRLEDQKIDSLDTEGSNHHDGATAAAGAAAAVAAPVEDGAMQLAEAEGTGAAEPAKTTAAPAKPAAPAAQPAADAGDMAEVENDAALLEQLVNGGTKGF